MNTRPSICTSHLALIFTVILAGCGDGFRAIQGPENDIVYIKNESASFVHVDAQERAQPLPLPILEGEPEFDVTGIKALAIAPKDVNTPPYHATARFTFNKGASPFYCSAQFVGQSDVVLTAAHCVYDDRWNNSFRVRTKYHLGASEQIIDWECAAIFSGWTQDKYQWDYAFLKVRGSTSNILNLSLSGIPSQTESIGYPSNIDGGQILQGVVGNILHDGSKIMAMQGNPFGGGSSGGAWHDSSNVLSINSHGYSNRPNVMFGPRFDGNVTKLYEFVEQGCPDASISAASVEAVPVRRGEGIIQPSSKIKSWAPSLRTRETDECRCEAEGIFLVNELGHNYEVELGIRYVIETDSRIVLVKLNRTLFIETFQSELATHHR